MAQEVEINIVEQTNQKTDEQFFRVDLQINNNNLLKTRRRYSVLSIPQSLKDSLKKWQTDFSITVNRRSRLGISTDEYNAIVIEDNYDDDGDMRDVNCWESSQNLITEFKNWVNKDWSEIQDLLTNYNDNYLDKSDPEIRVTIQTDNDLLKELPWQAWDVFTTEYPQAEISISPPEYEPPKGGNNIKRYPQVRILVILGANDNIDISFDEKLLNGVREHGAKIEFLKQPTLEELKNKLELGKQTGTGWNIIFYAGHSKTNDQRQGVLFLNNDDQEGITIDEIEKELNTAIENGLYLAIFNSCDGLGIANKLAELRLPQSIVMKEPIPNEIAVYFLQHFLESFSLNEPLFVAVSKARKQLKTEYNTPNKYPGGHWLPLIVPNPSVPLPTWKGFLSEYQLPFKLRIPAILLGMIGVIGLPLILFLEFGFEQSLFYAKLYPHIILYPIFILWAALWSVYKAFSQIIDKSKLRLGIAIALGISMILLSIEITSPNMFLFELSKSAQSTINNQTILQGKAIKGGLDSIKAIPPEIVNIKDIIHQDKITINKSTLEEALHNYIELKDANKLTKEQVTGFHNLMYLGLDGQTWKGRKNWVSLSRWFYGYTFVVIAFTVLIFFLFWIQSFEVRQFFNQSQFFQYLGFSQIMILLWIPFRLYYINENKAMIFGGKDNWWLQNLDIFVYTIVLILAILMIVRGNILMKKQKSWLIYTTMGTVFSAIFIGLSQKELLSHLFGLNTPDERIWIIYPIFIGLCFWAFLNKDFLRQ
jgi:hypothetical protein